MNANTRTNQMGKRLWQWIGAAALAVTLSGPAVAAIKDTKHNLTSATGTGVNKTTSTDQICVFCHTPHASNTTAGVPLWNKALPTSTYTVYSSDSMQGVSDMTNSASLVCLSCHDGSQAMDSTINAPGPGLGSGYAGAVGNWSGANQTAGALKAGIVTNLGTDLNNDHPIGIPYCGGGLAAASVGSSGAISKDGCNDKDFHDIQTAKIGSNQAYWVDVADAGITGAPAGVAGTRQRSDIALYKRGADVGAPYVECGSCHDPHVSAEGTAVSFMRVSTAGSKICLACHNK